MVDTQDPPKYPEFGKLLRERLTAMDDPSDAEVARAIGVTREMVRRYKRGEQMPRDTTMTKLAALIGVPPERLRYPNKPGDNRMSDPDAAGTMAVSPEERRLVEAHRQLPPVAQKALRARAVELLERFGKKSATNPWGQS